MRPSKIIGVGRNYRAHAESWGTRCRPSRFSSSSRPSSLIGDGEAILLPSVSQQVEFEAEIGIVAGARLRNLTVEEAEAAPLGFVVSTT